jgi:hypothetical protein
MSNWDPFKGDTGLKDDYDGTITAAEFLQDQRSKWTLQLTVHADDDEEPGIRLGLFGDTWTSYDGGETVEGPTKKATFDARSAYHRFMAAAMKAGAEDELRDRSNDIYGGRGPMHAALWVGLRFHFDVINVPGNRQNEAGEWVKAEGGIPVVLPTKFLGTASAPSATSAAPTSSPASTTTPAAQSNGAGSDIHPDDLAVLKVHASSLEYAAFADKVMTLNGQDGQSMLKNKPVMAALANKDWYESLKS